MDFNKWLFGRPNHSYLSTCALFHKITIICTVHFMQLLNQSTQLYAIIRLFTVKVPFVSVYTSATSEWHFPSPSFDVIWILFQVAQLCCILTPSKQQSTWIRNYSVWASSRLSISHCSEVVWKITAILSVCSYLSEVETYKSTIRLHVWVLGESQIVNHSFCTPTSTILSISSSIAKKKKDVWRRVILLHQQKTDTGTPMWCNTFL